MFKMGAIPLADLGIQRFFLEIDHIDVKIPSSQLFVPLLA
jgi:hypothetical protein